MGKYYVDRRRREVVKEESLNFGFLAPECYYEYSFGEDNDNIVEVWKCGNRELVTVLYDKKSSDESVFEIREKIFNKNNTEPLFLTNFIVPKDVFNETLEHYGLDKL